MKAPREHLRRAALVLLSVLVTLAVVEGVLRAFGLAPLPDTAAGGFRPDHPLLRLLRPHECKPFGTREGAYFVNVCTNEVGLRDRDHAADETPRVLGLGDSFTFGWGVESGDTFLAHLERAMKLGLPSKNPGVYNAGLSYTGQAHQDVLLRYLYADVHPDLVLLAFSEDNDIDENIVWNPNLGVFPEQGEIPPSAVEAYRGQLRNVVFQDSLYRHSALVRFFRQRHVRSSVAAEVEAVDARLKAHGLAGAPLSRMVADEARRRFLQAFSTAYDDDWRVTEILLERMRRFVADQNGRLVLLRIPSQMSVDDGAWAGASARFCGSEAPAGDACKSLDRSHTASRLKAYAEAHHLAYVDPSEDLRAGLARGEAMYLPNDIHLSRLGHTRLGERLAREVVPLLGGKAVGVDPVPANAGAKERKVGAYFYPWYRARDWRSVDVSDVGGLADYTPAGGSYLSNDPATIAQQLHWIERGEIDFVAVELLADHNPEAKFNSEAVRALVDAIEERRRRGFSRLQFAVMSDIFMGEAEIVTKERWLEFTRRHLDQIWSHIVEPHRDAYVTIDGKPLLGIFSPPTAIDDPRFTIVRPYWVSHPQWQEWDRTTELTPFWDTYPQKVTDPRFVSVTPGYNDWRLERKPQVGPFLPRLGGRTFVQQWRRAFEVDPKVVLVYSYNEYFEQSQIEPTVEQGDRYLLLNSILARHFKDHRPLGDFEAEHLPGILMPPAKPDEEKVSWVAIDDPRLTRRGLEPKNGRAELTGSAELTLEVESREAFIVGVAHAPSFDRCAGLSVTVRAEGQPKTQTFPTELTQLSILRDVPMAKSTTRVVLALERVPAAPGCPNAGTRPLFVTGVTRYPLPTAERLNFPVGHPSLTLENFWDVETPPEGAFSWSRGPSTIEVSGLAPGSRHRVTLAFRDTSNFDSVNVGTDAKHLQRVVITPGRTVACPEPVTVTADGKLRVSFETPLWYPRVLFHSEDQRGLGVALRLVIVDKVQGAPGPAHEHR
jgi:hypothetical protein